MSIEPPDTLSAEQIERITAEQREVTAAALKKSAAENPMRHVEHVAKAQARLDDMPPPHEGNGASADDREVPPARAYADDPEARTHGNGRDRHERTEDAEPNAGPRAFTLIWYASLEGAVHQPQLVRGLLLTGSLFEIYGESNSGKTFLALDLALAVARGTPWRGRRVTQGLVLYIAGEGAASVRNRVAAYRLANPDTPSTLPFAIIPHTVNLLNASSVALLLAIVQTAEAISGQKVALVLVDTLARAMPGGDENTSKDMGIVVGYADWVRGETGTAVGLIHHSGKDTSKGARGNSSLRAAIDTEILVEGQSGPRTVTVSKQRDLPTDPPFTFELVPAVIGRAADEDGGEDITSCTVRHSDLPVAVTLKVRVGANQERATLALREWARANPAAENITSIDVIAILKAQGVDRKRRPEVLDYFVRVGVLTPSVGGFTFCRAML